MLTRLIPSTQELLPAIGLGTWQTFDVSSQATYPALRQTLETLRAAGVASSIRRRCMAIRSK